MLKLLSFLLLVVFSAVSFGAKAREIKITSYNVLNLFDSVHDEDKEDHTFLPFSHAEKDENCAKISSKNYRKQCYETDWTEFKLQLKLNQIKKVIEDQGELPDILALQEVENENVVSMLAELLGYNAFEMTHSPDRRGIDVALLFRTEKLHFIDSEEIFIDDELFEKKPTRNILRVHFKICQSKSDQVLGLYVNHWPSLAGPTILRLTASWWLRANVEWYSNQIGSENYHVVALGDFNTLPREEPNPIESVISDPEWELALLDGQDEFLKTLGNKPLNMPANSYYYRGKWQKLDRVLLSKNLIDDEGLEFIPSSFKIFAPKFIMKEKKGEPFGVPRRYNFQTTDEEWLGFSDHLPIIFRISY